MESHLQIISGKYKRRRLVLSRDARPTQNRARIALFNMLASMIDGTRAFVVWDAFAGSGAFGAEFLSRYDTASVIFTDVSAAAFKVINKNVSGMSSAQIEMTDALSAVRRHGPVADVVFIDPPYADIALGVALVRKLANLGRSGMMVIWESEVGSNPQYSDDLWVLLRDKTYGRARFIILEKK